MVNISNGTRTAGLKALDPAPRWAVWPGYGTIALGTTLDEANIINDITEHTIDAILAAEKLGGWQALPEKDIFEVEYWELEQAKLNKSAKAPIFQGKIAVVTGAPVRSVRPASKHFGRKGPWSRRWISIRPLQKSSNSRKPWESFAT